MAGFLSNLRAVVWTGVALGVLFFLAYTMGVAHYSVTDSPVIGAFLRWGHVVSGIMWIGLLYYFNFVQIPNAPKIPEEARGPSIAKVIAPAALFWFRWAAMSTLVFGLLLAINPGYGEGYLLQALTLGATDSPAFSAPSHVFIGIGMWLAIIMWFNVWFVIWPAQQQALNIDNKFGNLAPEAKAAAAKRAMMFSRINTMLSIPMLVAMTGAQTLG